MSAVQFKVLGPPELSGAGLEGARLSSRLWCVLAGLLIADGRLVPAEVLADHLWDWRPPPKALATLRSYISRVNSILGRAGLRIGSRAGGYQLTVAPDSVDLEMFRALRRQAEAVAASGDRGRASALLSRAAELWRGPALMGLPGAWALAQRQALEDERYEAAKLRLAYELDIGHQVSVLGELRELSQAHPFDEEIAREFMTALYRLGRKADALATAREIGERFAEAGIEPGPALRDVHVRISRDDAGLGVTPRYRSAGQTAQPNTLPTGTRHFVGRTAELERLTVGCTGNVPHLKIIEGMPGVGKSALAVHVANHLSNRYADAQLFATLTGDAPDSARETLQQLLRALGVPAARIPSGTADLARLWQSEITCRRAIVVLDNASGPEQIRLIVPMAGDSLTIVTSQCQSDWPGQQVLRLEPLGTEDSVELLQRVAGLVPGRDAGKKEQAAILCGGHPLVLRVQAGRLREGDLADLDSLISELTEMHAGRVAGPEARRGIFAAFESSYRRMPTEERQVFRLLGIAPCENFGMDAAAALAGRSRTDADRCVRALVGRCLLERVSGDRLCFHSLVRSYAASCCAADEPEGESRRAVSRLIRYYSGAVGAIAAADAIPGQPGPDRGKADGIQGAFRGTGAVAAREWLEAERRNVLLAARYAAGHEQHGQCADLILALTRFMHTGGYWTDAVEALELALQAGHHAGDRTRVIRAAVELSAAYRRTGDLEKARQRAEEAQTVSEATRDERGRAAALEQLGLVCGSSGSARDSLACHGEAADLYSKIGDTAGLASAMMHQATAFGLLGRYQEESDHYDQALSLFRSAGDRRGEALCLNNIGALLDDRGLHRDAAACYEKSIAIFREIGGRQNLTILEHNLGRIRQYKGRHAEVISVFRKALAEYRAIGDIPRQAMALSDIGDAFAGNGCYAEALAHYGQSAEVAEATGHRTQHATALCGMAAAYRESGSYSTAMETYRKAHRLATEIEAPHLSGKALLGMGETLLITKGPGAAKLCWRQAHDIFTQLGVPEAALVDYRLHGTGAAAS